MLGSRIPSRDTDLGTGKARKIAKGLLDRKKQSAFYVNITKTGEIGLHPELITREEAADEIKRAERLSEETDRSSDEYKRLNSPPSFFKLKRMNFLVFWILIPIGESVIWSSQSAFVLPD